MAVAGVAALTAGQVPEVGSAAVAVLPLDVGQALALPAVPLALALVLRRALAANRAQEVTGAACREGRDRNTTHKRNTSAFKMAG